MAITRIKNSSIASKGPKYDNALAGLPYRPIIGTATDGGNGTTVSVAFTANNVAGAGVTYTALSDPGNFTGTGVASPVTVGGLTAGTAYTFQVKAGNSLGDSAYSASSNSVTPIQPTAFESIATATLSSTTTANFSSIPSTFRHLQLRWILTPASNTAIKMDFNGDTTSANYVVHDIYGNGTTVAASGITSYGSHLLKGFQNALSAQPNVGIVDILDYGSTTKNKTTRIFSGVDANGSGSVEINSGLYISTNAITSLSVYSSVNLTGTVALYGIKEF